MLYLQKSTFEASPKAISGRTSYIRVRLEFHRYPQFIRRLFNGGRFGPPWNFTSTLLYVLVGTGFQVLFHSPPGVLFTFPSQYYTLSVIRWYLGLEGGPPDFPRNSTCSAVLWILLAEFRFRLHDSHILWYAFPHISANNSQC